MSPPRVALFVPCYVDELWPAAGRAAVLLIEAAGFRVDVAPAVCCGQALDNAGEAREAGRIRAFWDAAHSDHGDVVVLSASCCGHLAKTRAKGPRVHEFCGWFVAHAPARFPKAVTRCVALHSSCSALRDTRTAAAARELLERVPELEVKDPVQADECCGFGGSFAASLADLSVRIGQDKVADLEAAAPRVDAIVSADCSCLIHLRGLAPEGLRFQHVAELLWEAVQ